MTAKKTNSSNEASMETSSSDTSTSETASSTSDSPEPIASIAPIDRHGRIVTASVKTNENSTKVIFAVRKSEENSNSSDKE
ncbi:MAG: hypothetical protein K8S15_10445 [Candidatus Aegiribacteria sp.]|nr:hypothetical protein [Candidatus Aegiribacteria sp.]